ncbi:hypothetical protein ABTX77_42070 [Streptomyces sp. NPDC097704]|uniref:hypothetical protein n=1 Tax=Streptomyces sp. NPDC097704 TaxID=3157101 RepID=UPI00331B9DD2
MTTTRPVRRLTTMPTPQKGGPMSPDTRAPAAVRRVAMVRRRESDSGLTAPRPREAFLSVRREVLLPHAYVRVSGPGADPIDWRLLDGSHPDDREEWTDLIHSDESILLQRDGERLDTLVRETREETGLVVDPDDVCAAVAVHRRAPAGDARIGVFCEVRSWSGAPEVMEPVVCDRMEWFGFDSLPEPMVAYCRAGLDAYRAGARMALHFQEPGDPIGYAPAVDRLRLVPAPGSDGPQPAQEVRDFAEGAVGRITRWSDASWARGTSQVWRVTGAGGGCGSSRCTRTSSSTLGRRPHCVRGSRVRAAPGPAWSPPTPCSWRSW